MKESKQTTIFFVLGLLGTFGWLLHLFQIFSVLFNDKSAKLGFSENYGFVIVDFILYIAVKVNKRNKSNKKKLYKHINRGRDVEAEYYGGKEHPF